MYNFVPVFSQDLKFVYRPRILLFVSIYYTPDLVNSSNQIQHVYNL